MEAVGGLSQVLDLFGKVYGAARALESAYDAAKVNDQYATDQFNKMWRIANRINVCLHQSKLCKAPAGSTGKGYEANICQELKKLDSDLYQAYEQVFHLAQLCWLWKMWRAGAIKTRLEQAVNSFKELQEELESDIKKSKQLQEELVPAGNAPLLQPGLALPKDLSTARATAEIRKAHQLMARMVVGSTCACCPGLAERRQLAAVNQLSNLDGPKQAVVVAAGVIQVLVQLVMRGSDAMTDAALEALFTLAARDAAAASGKDQHASEAVGTQAVGAAAQVKDIIRRALVFKAPGARDRVAASASGELVRMLASSSSSMVQAQSVAVLVALAAFIPSSLAAIVQAGGIRVYVELLNNSPAEAVLSQAAAALANLCNGSEASNEEAIVQADGIPALVHLLQNSARDQEDPAGVQQAAAAALCNLATGSEAISAAIVEHGGLPPLLWLLASCRLEVQLQAAKALRNLALCSRASQVEIGEAPGCIETLMQMLQSNSKETQEEAAFMLASLSLRCPENQAAIATAGAISTLLELELGGGAVEGCSIAVQHAAAVALASLAAGNSKNEAAIAKGSTIRDLLQQLANSSSAEEQEGAALVLLMAAREETEVQEAIAAAEGGIAAIVRLLASSEEGVAVGAAHVLGSLAERSGEHQAAIAAVTGSIPLLVQQLQRDRSSRMQQVAAAALHHLAVGSPENGAAIASAQGCIPALVELLGCSINNEHAATDRINQNRQEAAALALGAIAASSSTVQEEVVAEQGCLPALVRLLWSNDDDVKVAAAGALMVISGGSRSAALAAGGGIAPLVELLHSSNRPRSQDLQRVAAAALGFMARGSPSTAAAIADAKAVPRLVQLLHGSQEVQMTAAFALGSLAAAGPSLAGAVAAADGAVPALKKLLKSPEADVREEARAALDNLKVAV